MERFFKIFIILVLLCLSGCAKKFRYEVNLLKSDFFENVELEQYDVYSYIEYYDFNKRYHTPNILTKNSNIERVGINYLMIQKVDEYPKEIFQLSPVKFYSQNKNTIFFNQSDSFSSFARSYFDDPNIIDIRQINYIRKGYLFKDGIIKFDTLNFWKIEYNKNEIIIDSTSLSTGMTTSLSKYFPFPYTYKKLNKPKYIFSDMNCEGKINITPVTSIIIFQNEHQIYFKFAESYKEKNYYVITNRFK